MKKSILFIIPSLGSGGAEKSLLSLLSMLPDNLYDIKLMVVSPKGLFIKNIPKNITIIHAPKNLRLAVGSIHDISNYNKYDIVKKIISNIIVRLRVLTKYDNFQFTWKIWKKYIPESTAKYDIAVSYMNGITNYYTIDKINAQKKILWVHNDYKKLTAFYKFDLKYFQKADKVITISDLCAQSLIETFPEISNKFMVLENISSKKTIEELSIQFYPKEYNSINHKLKLLSIGRLAEQKGFDYAIKAAKILKEKQIDFKWFIIGTGHLKEKLSKDINENNLADCIELLGERSNPYPYIRHCSFFIQTSLFEGKSIVIDEAKILAKPIISTNYPTVKDNIENNLTGIICDLSPSSIANTIIYLADNPQLQENLTSYLSQNYKGNEQEVYKYINLFQ